MNHWNNAAGVTDALTTHRSQDAGLEYSLNMKPLFYCADSHYQCRNCSYSQKTYLLWNRRASVSFGNQASSCPTTLKSSRLLLIQEYFIFFLKLSSLSIKIKTSDRCVWEFVTALCISEKIWWSYCCDITKACEMKCNFQFICRQNRKGLSSYCKQMCCGHRN